MKRLVPAALVASLILVVVSPPSADAAPGLKVTHECALRVSEGIGEITWITVYGLRANEMTACRTAERAIHHGNVRTGRFRTKYWVCKRQNFSFPGGEYVKCRRGTDEAFEFRWASTQ